MGAGKTEVARLVGKRLRREAVDTDARIEAETGRSIRDLFASQGETAFRRLERTAIDAVAGQPLVVALGGGAMAQPGVPDRLSESGISFYLRARPETLLSRLGDADTRPLLADLDGAERAERLKGLLAERSASYERADHVIDTDDLALTGVADRVVAAAQGTS